MNERERIELLMKCYNLTSSQFADRAGIQRASVSHILSGRNKPSLEVMLKIYEAFPGLDMKWLMTGTGESPAAVTSQNLAESPLFAAVEEPDAVEDGLSHVALLSETEQEVRNVRPVRSKMQSVSVTQAEKPARRGSQQRVATQQSGLQQRRIKEVRIFYTDGTYETLVPEKL